MSSAGARGRLPQPLRERRREAEGCSTASSHPPKPRAPRGVWSVSSRKPSLIYTCAQTERALGWSMHCSSSSGLPATASLANNRVDAAVVATAVGQKRTRNTATERQRQTERNEKVAALQARGLRMSVLCPEKAQIHRKLPWDGQMPRPPRPRPYLGGRPAGPRGRCSRGRCAPGA